jgi:hypothetical protein
MTNILYFPLFATCIECNDYYGREKKQYVEPRGYTPSIETILGSETLSVREKDTLLGLYHNREITQVKTRYDVQKLDNSKYMVKRVGKQIANLYKQEPRTFFNLVDEVLNRI